MKVVTAALVSLVSVLAHADQTIAFREAKGPIVNITVSDTEITFAANANGWVDFSRYVPGLADLKFSNIRGMTFKFPRELCKVLPTAGYPLIECEFYYDGSPDGTSNANASIILSEDDKDTVLISRAANNPKGIDLNVVRASLKKRVTEGASGNTNEAVIDFDSFMSNPFSNTGTSVKKTFTYKER